MKPLWVLTVLVGLSGCATSGPDASLADAGGAIDAVTRPAGTVFRDRLKSGGEGPAMVVLPSGSFLMGGPNSEAWSDSGEVPPREVQLRAFAMGQTEVTRGEFVAFVNATGYRTDAEKNTAVRGSPAEGCIALLAGSDFGWKAGASWRAPGFEQHDSHPAVCMSWNDAQAYASWLSRETGQAYRLPSAAEQEYAIRAGTTTPWAWGDDADAGCRYANGADARLLTRFPSRPAMACDDGHVFTSPVGAMRANAFGLHDTVGNVMEWSGDCAASGHGPVPADGADCGGRVLRGGSWGDSPSWLRSSHHGGEIPEGRASDIGFRVVRVL